MTGEWKPINTAPLGRWVLVKGQAHSSFQPPIDVARSEERKHEWWETISDDTKRLRKEIVIDWYSGLHMLDMTPSHWAELPDA